MAPRALLQSLCLQSQALGMILSSPRCRPRTSRQSPSASPPAPESAACHRSLSCAAAAFCTSRPAPSPHLSAAPPCRHLLEGSGRAAAKTPPPAAAAAPTAQPAGARQQPRLAPRPQPELCRWGCGWHCRAAQLLPRGREASSAGGRRRGRPTRAAAPAPCTAAKRGRRLVITEEHTTLGKT